MKKLLSLFLAVVMVISVFTMQTFAVEKDVSNIATQSMSGSFYTNYTLTGSGATDMVNIAMAQNERTQPQIGYTENWCADFVSDCARLAGQSSAVPFNGAVTSMYYAVIDAGGTRVSTAQAGDLVFFYDSNESQLGHVGIALDSYRNISGNIYYKGTSPSRVCILENKWEGYNYWFYVRPNYDNNTPTYNDIPYPVTKIYSDRKVYRTNETITINWEPAFGTQNYWIYLWKDGNQLYSYDCGKNLSFTSAPTSAGSYTLIIRPGNSYGFNDNSANCQFIVTDDVPQPVTTLTSEKNVYTSSESINFTWESVYGAENYWIYLWKDGMELYGLDCGSKTSFTSAPTSPGIYTLIIRPSNINGYNNNSNSYTFVVSDGYTIVYNPNGGTGAPESQLKNHGENISLSNITPSREGYIFMGWGESEISTEPLYQPGSIYSENKTLTLYAIWEKDNTTSYILGDVDDDKNISIMDATLIQRNVAKQVVLTDIQTKAGDTDKDGKISVMDATAIQRYIAKLIEEF